MIISKAKRESIVGSGLRFQIPTTLMTLRIASASVEKKGFDAKRNCDKYLLSTQVEVMAPETVTVGGNEVALAGLKFFFMPQRVEAETCNENWAFAAVNKALNISGFDWNKFPNGDFDSEHVKAALVDHVMFATVSCEPKHLTRELTEDEHEAVAAGKEVPNLSDDKRRVHITVTQADGSETRAQDGFQLVCKWENVKDMKFNAAASGAVAAPSGGVF